MKKIILLLALAVFLSSGFSLQYKIECDDSRGLITQEHICTITDTLNTAKSVDLSFEFLDSKVALTNIKIATAKSFTTKTASYNVSVFNGFYNETVLELNTSEEVFNVTGPQYYNKTYSLSNWTTETRSYKYTDSVWNAAASVLKTGQTGTTSAAISAKSNMTFKFTYDVPKNGYGKWNLVVKDHLTSSVLGELDPMYNSTECPGNASGDWVISDQNIVCENASALNLKTTNIKIYGNSNVTFYNITNTSIGYSIYGNSNVYFNNCSTSTIYSAGSSAVSIYNNTRVIAPASTDLRLGGAYVNITDSLTYTASSGFSTYFSALTGVYSNLTTTASGNQANNTFLLGNHTLTNSSLNLGTGTTYINFERNSTVWMVGTVISPGSSGYFYTSGNSTVNLFNCTISGVTYLTNGGDILVQDRSNLSASWFVSTKMASGTSLINFTNSGSYPDTLALSGNVSIFNSSITYAPGTINYLNVSSSTLAVQYVYNNWAGYFARFTSSTISYNNAGITWTYSGWNNFIFNKSTVGGSAGGIFQARESNFTFIDSTFAHSGGSSIGNDTILNATNTTLPSMNFYNNSYLQANNCSLGQLTLYDNSTVYAYNSSMLSGGYLPQSFHNATLILKDTKITATTNSATSFLNGKRVDMNNVSVTYNTGAYAGMWFGAGVVNLTSFSDTGQGYWQFIVFNGTNIYLNLSTISTIGATGGYGYIYFNESSTTNAINTTFTGVGDGNSLTYQGIYFRNYAKGLFVNCTINGLYPDLDKNVTIYNPRGFVDGYFEGPSGLRMNLSQTTTWFADQTITVTGTDYLNISNLRTPYAGAGYLRTSTINSNFTNFSVQPGQSHGDSNSRLIIAAYNNASLWLNNSNFDLDFFNNVTAIIGYSNITSGSYLGTASSLNMFAGKLLNISNSMILQYGYGYTYFGSGQNYLENVYNNGYYHGAYASYGCNSIFNGSMVDAKNASLTQVGAVGQSGTLNLTSTNSAINLKDSSMTFTTIVIANNTAANITNTTMAGTLSFLDNSSLFNKSWMILNVTNTSGGFIPVTVTAIKNDSTIDWTGSNNNQTLQAGIINHIQNATARYNYTMNISATATGYIDNSTLTNMTATRYITLTMQQTILGVAPYVIILSPVNNSWNKTINVNFTYNTTITGSTFGNASLWTNLSGAWAYTWGNTSEIVNNSINGLNYTFPVDQDILWNIEVNDSSGFSNFSQFNFTLRIDSTPPSQVLNLLNITQYATWINNSWDVSTDARSGIAGYIFYQNNTNIANTTALSFNNTGLSEYTSYNYTVSAYDVAGNIGNNATFLITRTYDITNPNITLTNLSSLMMDNWVYFSWVGNDSGSGINQYRIYRNGTNVANTTNQYYNLTGLTRNNNYLFNITAADNSGNSNTSAWGIRTNSTLSVVWACSQNTTRQDYIRVNDTWLYSTCAWNLTNPNGINYTTESNYSGGNYSFIGNNTKFILTFLANQTIEVNPFFRIPLEIIDNKTYSGDHMLIKINTTYLEETILNTTFAYNISSWYSFALYTCNQNSEASCGWSSSLGFLTTPLELHRSGDNLTTTRFYLLYYNTAGGGGGSSVGGGGGSSLPVCNSPYFMKEGKCVLPSIVIVPMNINLNLSQHEISQVVLWIYNEFNQGRNVTLTSESDLITIKDPFIFIPAKTNKSVEVSVTGKDVPENIYLKVALNKSIYKMVNISVTPVEKFQTYSMENPLYAQFTSLKKYMGAPMVMGDVSFPFILIPLIIIAILFGYAYYNKERTATLILGIILFILLAASATLPI